MDFEDIFPLIIITLIFYIIGIVLFVFGFQFMGIIKPKKFNKPKWVKTTAMVVGKRNVAEKTIGKGPRVIYYREFTIVYEANGKKYKKFAKNLPDSIHRICIVYKRKNPNYFKLVSELKCRENISIPTGIFLCILGLYIFIGGCLIISSFF